MMDGRTGLGRDLGLDKPHPAAQSSLDGGCLRRIIMRYTLCVVAVGLCAISACRREKANDSLTSRPTTEPGRLTRERAGLVVKEALVSMGWSLQDYELIAAEEVELTDRQGWSFFFHPKTLRVQPHLGDGGEFFVFVPTEGEAEINGQPLSVLKSRSTSRRTSTTQGTTRQTTRDVE